MPTTSLLTVERLRSRDVRTDDGTERAWGGSFGVILRAGWYRVRDHETFVYGAGIGVKPWWRETDTARPGRQVDVLAYAFVWQHNVDWNRRWHMMALVIPLVWQ